MTIQEEYNEIFKNIENRNKEFGNWLDSKVEKFRINYRGMGSLNGTWTKVNLDGDILWTTGDDYNYKAGSEFGIAKSQIEIIT